MQPHSPHQITVIDGKTYIVDETGRLVDLNQITEAVRDDNGLEVSVSDLLGVHSPYEIVAIEDSLDFTNADELMDIIQLSAHSTFDPTPMPDVETDDATCAPRNLPKPHYKLKEESRCDSGIDSMKSLSIRDGTENDFTSLTHTRVPKPTEPAMKTAQKESCLGADSAAPTVDVAPPMPLPSDVANRDVSCCKGKRFVLRLKQQGEQQQKGGQHYGANSPTHLRANKTEEKIIQSRQSADQTQTGGAFMKSNDNDKDDQTNTDEEQTQSADDQNQYVDQSQSREDQNQSGDDQTQSSDNQSGEDQTQNADDQTQNADDQTQNADDQMRINGEFKSCQTVGPLDCIQKSSRLICEKMSEGLWFFTQTGDIKYLLALFRHFLHSQDCSGDNAFHLAVIHGQLESLRHLLGTHDQLEGSDALNVYNEVKQTPLHLAVICREYAMVELLIEHGAQLDRLNGEGNNAMHLAAAMGLHRCITSAVTKVPDVSILKRALSVLNCEGLSALHLAVRADSLRCVEEVIAGGADINQRDGKSGYTALHHAVDTQRASIVGLLLMQERIEVDIPGYNGATALLIAVSKQNLGLAAALISSGADPLSESAEPLDSDNDDDTDTQTAAADRLYLTPSHLAATNIQMKRIIDGERYSFVKAEPDRPYRHASGITTAMINSHPDTVGVLDIVTRSKLAKLLDSPNSLDNWQALAKLFRLDELILILQTFKSPSSCLLDNLEAMKTTILTLKENLQQLGRQDAIAVLDEARSIRDEARKQVLADGWEASCQR